VAAYRPRLSALALTPEANDAGGSAQFSLLDILDARTRAQLVVLSACDTSSGKLLAGEGVLGPAQAFLQSGARSVLASHWRVSDADTATFMLSFYRHLLEEYLPVGAALRSAQLQTRDPHHWAAFSLYGWPEVRFESEPD